MVPLQLGLNEKPRRDATGIVTSLTLFRHGQHGDALSPDNGGQSGSSYSAFNISPCGSEVHSSLSCVRGSHLIPALYNVVSAATRPLQRLIGLELLAEYKRALNEVSRDAFRREKRIGANHSSGPEYDLPGGRSVELDYELANWMRVISLFLLITLVACGSQQLFQTEPAITHGVASGDVAADSAVIWSRANTAATMKVEIRPEEGTGNPILAEVANSPDKDFAAQVELQGLEPNTDYVYTVRFENLSGVSDEQSGRLRTAPSPTSQSNVSLIWAGDLGGQGYCRRVEEGYSIFRAMLDIEADFFIASGDMINADSICEEKGPQDGWVNIVGEFPSIASQDVNWENRKQVDEVYAAHWRYNRSDQHFQDFLRLTPVYAQWDDHEVINDFGASWIWQHADPQRRGYGTIVDSGLRMLLNYHPMQVSPDRMYRSFKWGEALELFMLDTRSFRSENFQRDSHENAKTMLGPAQLEWLKEGLVNSSATWKIVSGGVPLSVPTGKEVEALGHDSWANGIGPGLASQTGFERELLDLLTVLDEHDVENVVYIAADTHFPAQIRYRIDLDDDGDFLLFHELISSPLSSGLESPPEAFDPTLDPEVLYAEGNLFNFGVVRIEYDLNGLPWLWTEFRDEQGGTRPDSLLILKPRDG